MHWSMSLVVAPSRQSQCEPVASGLLKQLTSLLTKNMSPRVGYYLKLSVGKWSQPDRIYKSSLNSPNECTRSPKCHRITILALAHVSQQNTNLWNQYISRKQAHFSNFPLWTIWINRDLQNTTYRIKRSILVSIFQTNWPRCLSWKNRTFHFRANSYTSR